MQEFWCYFLAAYMTQGLIPLKPIFGNGVNIYSRYLIKYVFPDHGTAYELQEKERQTLAPLKRRFLPALKF